MAIGPLGGSRGPYEQMAREDVKQAYGKDMKLSITEPLLVVNQDGLRAVAVRRGEAGARI